MTVAAKRSPAGATCERGTWPTAAWNRALVTALGRRMPVVATPGLAGGVEEDGPAPSVSAPAECISFFLLVDREAAAADEAIELGAAVPPLRLVPCSGGVCDLPD